MPDEIEIKPAPGVEPPPPAEGGSDLPSEVIQQPVFQALMAGSPPAASAPLAGADKTPIGKIVAKYGPQLQESGFGFYRSQDGNLGVIFNQLYVNPDQVIKADQQGQLTQLAPSVDQIEQAILADPSKNPVLSAQGTPATAAQPPVPGGAPSNVAPPSGKVARALASGRKQALTPKGPSSGPKPGAGRVLNAIMQPVV
jgi:hypothetical protein